MPIALYSWRSILITVTEIKCQNLLENNMADLALVLAVLPAVGMENPQQPFEFPKARCPL